MFGKKLVLVSIIVVLLSSAVTAIALARQDELAPVRRANAQYKRLEVAEAAGFQLVPGLDYCFNKPGVGAMGFHYINVAQLDLELDFLHPEALVYAPGPQGQLNLAAVEYIVPAQAWDEAGNSTPPSVAGHMLHLNEALGVYVLHAWIFMNNPEGMFEDWNPNVTCP